MLCRLASLFPKGFDKPFQSDVLHPLSISPLFDAADVCKMRVFYSHPVDSGDSSALYTAVRTLRLLQCTVPHLDFPSCDRYHTICSAECSCSRAASWTLIRVTCVAIKLGSASKGASQLCPRGSHIPGRRCMFIESTSNKCNVKKIRSEVGLWSFVAVHSQWLPNAVCCLS